MFNDKRKSQRRAMRYTAWVVLAGNKLHGCILSDISDTGARIGVEDSKIIPDDFMLLLSGNGSARRRCRVVWRKPAQVGVTFERRIADAERATLVPKLSAGMPAKAQAETD
jgi:hypothetical protein